MTAGIEPPVVHADADVEEGAIIGAGTRVWAFAVVRRGAEVGPEVIVGRNAFIDAGVVVGARCKIQNNALLYAPAHLEDGVFVGPGVILTNDVTPRAINADGSRRDAADWTADGVHVCRGAALGAGSTIVAGVRIGRWALIAAGAVVVADVLDHALVAGVPARQLGWVGVAGHRLLAQPDGIWRCAVDGSAYQESPEGLQQC